MFSKQFLSKTYLRGQFEVLKYIIRMRKKSDDEIRSTVDHERNLRAWCSQRSYYLAALRYECHRRGLAYIQ